MRKIVIGLALAAILASVECAFGQLPGPGPGNVGAPFQAQGGHFSLGGGLPPSVNSACGTGAVVAGSDSSFQLTSGTGTSSACTITPAVPWNRRPTCSVDAQVATQPAWSISPSGVITLTGVADSTSYNVICIGQPGG